MAAPDDDQRARDDGDRFEHFLEEAVEAEFETGRREPTAEAAKRHLIVRLARIIAGTVLVIVGLLLLVAPGPGLLVIAIGLGLLAQDVPFARNLLEKVRERLPEDEDGSVKPWVIVVSVAGTIVFTGGSIWYAFFR